ncbi:MAG: hypothetical protein WB676_29330 [Bryobacteraceae bacterium]
MTGPRYKLECRTWRQPEEIWNRSAQGRFRHDHHSASALTPRLADSRSLSAALHKGMSEAHDTSAAGNAATRNAKYISSMDIVECTYQLPDGSLNAQFVNRVLTSYTLSSR